MKKTVTLLLVGGLVAGVAWAKHHHPASPNAGMVKAQQRAAAKQQHAIRHEGLRLQSIDKWI